MDDVVCEDEYMYHALLEVKSRENVRHGNAQNAMRKYYEFINGRTFARLANYGCPNQRRRG